MSCFAKCPPCECCKAAALLLNAYSKLHDVLAVMCEDSVTPGNKECYCKLCMDTMDLLVAMDRPHD